MTGPEILAALVAAAGLVALGHWMGSRSSKSTLEAMRALDQVTILSTSSLSQVTQQAAQAMNDPRLLSTLQSLATDARSALERIETTTREAREATMMLHGADRTRVEETILRHPSPKPVVSLEPPAPVTHRGGWGSPNDGAE